MTLCTGHAFLAHRRRYAGLVCFLCEFGKRHVANVIFVFLVHRVGVARLWRKKPQLTAVHVGNQVCYEPMALEAWLTRLRESCSLCLILTPNRSHWRSPFQALPVTADQPRV